MSYYRTTLSAPPHSVKDIHGADVYVGDKITYQVPRNSYTPNTGYVKEIKLHRSGARAGVVYLVVDFNQAIVEDNMPGADVISQAGMRMKTYNVYPKTSGNMYRIEKI